MRKANGFATFAIILLVIVVGAVVAVVFWSMKNKAAQQPLDASPAASATASAIPATDNLESEVNAVSISELDGDFSAVDADIKSL